MKDYDTANTKVAPEFDYTANTKVAPEFDNDGWSSKHYCRERVVDMAIRALGSAASDPDLVIESARKYLAFIEE